MRKELSGESGFRNFCGKVSVKLNKWWIKRLAIPIVASVPPALLLFYLRPPQIFHTKNIAIPQLPDFITNFVLNYPIYFALVIPLYIVVVNSINDMIESLSKGKEDIDTQGLLTLFETLEHIVGAKSERFGLYAKQIKDKTIVVNKNAIFEAISKPEQQIALLAEGLHSFFNAIDKSSVDFSVTVASVHDSVPADWFYFYPPSSPPKTTINDLISPESAVSYCIKKRKLVVIGVR